MRSIYNSYAPATLSAHYQMNENTNSVAVVDSSGNDNDGIAAQNTDQISVSGKINGAFSFNGAGDIIAISADPAIDINGKSQLSVCAWIKPASVGQTTGRIIDKCNNNSPTLGYSFFLREEVAGFTKLEALIQHANTDAVAISNAAVVPNDVWSHAAFTYNEDADGKNKLYRNGVLLTLGTDTPADVIGTPSDDSAVVLNIGNSLSEDRTFDGIIDNVMIFNKALTARQVKRLYDFRIKEPIFCPNTNRIYNNDMLINAIFGGTIG